MGRRSRNSLYIFIVIFTIGMLYMLHNRGEKSAISNFRLLDHEDSVTLSFSLNHRYNQTRSLLKTSQKKYSGSKRIALVLLDWTLFFGKALQTDFQLWACPELNCIISADRSLLNSSQAVIFHLMEINWSDLPLYRRPEQLYTVLSHESPPHTAHLDLRKAPMHYFNLSLTYRHDSSVYAPYSMFIKRQVNLPPSVLEKGQAIITGKKKLVAWFVSNCVTTGKREDYVKELQKHVLVDIYGKCGPLKCEDRDACRQMLNRDYKFYVSFENSHCKDYITEKFTSLFELDTYVIPVVMMKSNYINYAPPNSYISVEDFSSPKHLADYLKELDRNLTAYWEYFEYKLSYERASCERGRYCGFCRLCELSHMENPSHQTVEDMNAWWNAPGICDPDFVPRLLGKKS